MPQRREVLADGCAARQHVSEQSFTDHHRVPWTDRVLQARANRRIFSIDLSDDLYPAGGPTLGDTTRQREHLADRHPLPDYVLAG